MSTMATSGYSQAEGRSGARSTCASPNTQLLYSYGRSVVPEKRKRVAIECSVPTGSRICNGSIVIRRGRCHWDDRVVVLQRQTIS